MANLTTAEAERADKVRGKMKNLTIGTRIKALEDSGTGSDDLVLGEDATGGSLTIYPDTTNSGTLVFTASDSTGDDVVTLTGPATNTGGDITIKLPHVAGTLLHSGVADQSIAGDLALGSDTVEGTLTLNSTTTAKGTLLIKAVDNTGNDVVTLANHASTGAAMTATLPAFTGNIMVYESTQRFIPLSLVNAREVTAGDPGNISVNGGILASDTTPILEAANGATNSELRINWASSNVDPIAISTALPPDINVAADLVFHFRATTGASTDTFKLTLESWFNEGDTKITDTSAANLSQNGTYAEGTITIAASDIPAGAQTLTINLFPATHGSDTCLLNAACWLEYTGVALTA